MLSRVMTRTTRAGGEEGGTGAALYHRWLWTAALAAALLWPSPTLSAFDGAPLSGRLEALVVGVLVPALWWVDRDVLRRRWMRSAIVSIVIVRVAGAFLVQEGWCARFSTDAPLSGTIQTIPIDEPDGVLRSWDIRADWRAANPRCTAILDRPYRTADAFPAWFMNVLEHLPTPRRPVRMDVTGSITVAESGTLTLDTDETMQVSGRVGDQPIVQTSGRSAPLPLAAGTYPVALHALLADQWTFAPLWNGRPAGRAVWLTVAPSGRAAWLAARAVGVVSTTLIAGLAAGWLLHALMRLRLDRALLAWSAAASVLVASAAAYGWLGRVSLVAIGAALVIPVAGRNRNARGAFWLVGVPWLAFFASRSFGEIGRVAHYSGDDYLTYQLAGARIFMHGHWLEGGTRTFDYQPLYRWICGLLHVIFGDSSVGETYADAFWLLAGAMLAFAMARRFAGFRAGVAAASGTLITFALSPTWYFVGRGLSEVAAAGLGFLAAAFLLRSRLGRTRSAVAGALCAVLMFYTRLNQLTFAPALVVMLLPTSAPIRASGLVRGLRRVPARFVALHAALLGGAVALFAARTWWYTGHFSVLYGTSLKNNDIGPRQIAHSLSTLIWANEPGGVDVRTTLVAAGVFAAVAAACQVPRLREMPALLVLAVLAATISAFFVHTHNYPGRMSIHLMPFAVSAAVCAGASVGSRRAREQQL